MIVALEDSGIEELKDLEGRKHVLGPSGSSNELFSKRLLETLGLEADTSSLPVDDSVNSLTDGILDSFTTTWPTPAITRLEADHKINIITLNDEEKAIFEEEYAQYSWLSIPEGEYNAIPDGVDNFGMTIFAMARKDVDEDAVYEIVKAVYENIDIIEQTNPAMAEELRLMEIENSTIPYHPGAIKYFEELDLELPEELLPPEY